MRSLINFVLLAAASVPAGATLPGYQVAGDEPGAWPQILSSIGLEAKPGEASRVLIVRNGPAASHAQWLTRVERGAIVVIEGESELATAFGFKPTPKRIVVRNIVDERRPKLPVIWERAVEMQVFELPAGARVFARERWHSAPVLASVAHGSGAVLWLAVPPGDKGYERFPYLLQALADLGMQAPYRSRNLWAFFDSSYRMRVDVEWFAERWRKAGIGALHIAAWHYYEPDAQRDEYLKKLIEACHRNSIQVYAWIELPHVSERFWQEHPEWREKTALLQDAHLDWRKLMNLQNRDCFRAVAAGTKALIERFDWDGINLGELYFESLEGNANASRFTPLNDDVRREYRELAGVDPVELFRGAMDAGAMRKFLDYRSDLARRMQEEWIGELEKVRRSRKHLDLVLTHVDDRFDTRMRDLIGADAARLLPMLGKHDFTFLIEDPATVWHLGPERYAEIARRYAPLTPHQRKLAIDINIVERYQDVYPTKQQTGTELFQLVHVASQSFERVALYFENSILPPDLPLLSSAAAAVKRTDSVAGKLVVESAHGVGISWNGPAAVNGRTWPVADANTLWLPPGPAAVEKAAAPPHTRILDFDGRIRSATSLSNGVEFAYESSARAFATLDRKPIATEIDGESAQVRLVEAGGRFIVALPRGQHLVTFRTE